jgi:lysophospholipase L1-like esterase
VGGERTGMKDVAKIFKGWKDSQDESFRVVAFGSSNTELSWWSNGRHNWVDWLYINFRANIGRNVTVINQGISGDTTQQLLDRINRDVLSFQPSMVIITIGGNDASKGISLSQYIENLQYICSIIQENNSLPVLQTYYCPVYNEGTEGFEELFEDFVQANRDISKKLSLPLIDQYAKFEPFYRKNKEDYKKIMRDWIHVNYLGNFIMGLNASKALGLPELEIPEDIEHDVKFLLKKMHE